MFNCLKSTKLTNFYFVSTNSIKKKDYDIFNLKKTPFSNISKLSRKQQLQSFSFSNKKVKNSFSEKDLNSFLTVKKLPKLDRKNNKTGLLLTKKQHILRYKFILSHYKRRLFVFSKISFYNYYSKFFYNKLNFIYKKQKTSFFEYKKLVLKKSLTAINFINYNQDVIYNKYLITAYKSKSIFINNTFYSDLNKQRLFPFKFFLNPVKPNIYSTKTLLVNSLLVNRIIGIFIKKGNRTLSEKQLFNSVGFLKRNFYNSSFKLSFFFRYFILLLVLYAPKLTLRNRRKGSVVYKVPFFITPYQQHSIFLKWLKDSTFKRIESTHPVRFRKEILDLFDQNVSSATLKKHIELHNSVIKNRAFAHFRWI